MDNKIINVEKLAHDLMEKRILVERKSLGTLSNDLGISVATLSRIENKKQPELANYINICKYLNKPYATYIKEDQNQREE